MLAEGEEAVPPVLHPLFHALPGDRIDVSSTLLRRIMTQ